MIYLFPPAVFIFVGTLLAVFYSALADIKLGSGWFYMLVILLPVYAYFVLELFERVVQGKRTASHIIVIVLLLSAGLAYPFLR